ncbi:MAG TPA: hypothetical protein VF017_10135 [Thermoanaerobaculia bacterium]|nr:hypothetical protein [Thermoanaerobaculia bacterium]
MSRLFTLLALLAVPVLDAKAAKPAVVQRSQPPPTTAASLGRSDADWSTILEILTSYRKQNVENTHAGVFAQQLLNVARISFENRAEVGGWAGDLTRGSLYYAAVDIRDHYSRWMGPAEGWYAGLVDECARRRSEDSVGAFLLGALFGGIPDGLDAAAAKADDTAYLCGAFAKGTLHLDEHVRPFLRLHASAVVSRVSSNPQNFRLEAVVSGLRSMRLEHEEFLQKALRPGFEKIPVVAESLWLEEISDFVQSRAREERRSAMGIELRGLATRRLITSEKAVELCSTLCP